MTKNKRKTVAELKSEINFRRATDDDSVRCKRCKFHGGYYRDGKTKLFCRRIMVTGQQFAVKIGMTCDRATVKRRINNS